VSIRGPTQGRGWSDSGSRGEMGGISRMRVIVVRSKEVCLCGQAIERGGGGGGKVDVEREEVKQRVVVSISFKDPFNHAGRQVASSKYSDV
jgi:hypothetical protein